MLTSKLDKLDIGKIQSGDAGEGATLNQVIDPGREKDPHGSLVLNIVYRPGLLEDGYGGSRDSDPINIEVVRGTDDI